jgi:DNA-binding SARP family transcriptional activator/DNA-binding XRE family transcriptional regulator
MVKNDRQWRNLDRRLGHRSEFGALIRERRIGLGMSQLELVTAAQISLGTLRDLEQGRVALPRTSTAQRLIMVLGLADSGTALSQEKRDTLRYRYGSDLWVEALGPLTMVRGHRSLSLAHRERTLFALLILAQGNAVNTESVIDVLWGESPPVSARTMLHTYISRLRALISGSGHGGAENLISRDSMGYRLRLTAENLDILKFQQVIGRARVTVDAAAACKRYEEALALWRGQVLADVPLLKNHHAVITLGSERMRSVLEFAERATRAGLSGHALPHLEGMAGISPFHEQVHAALMTTLAACGRRGEALRVYEDMRRRLDKELGVPPARVLRQALAEVTRNP